MGSTDVVAIVNLPKTSAEQADNEHDGDGYENDHISLPNNTEPNTSLIQDVSINEKDLPINSTLTMIGTESEKLQIVQDQAESSYAEISPNETRRRSTRDIKRPKFDDEIVENFPQLPTKLTPKRKQLSDKAGTDDSSIFEYEHVKRRKTITKNTDGNELLLLSSSTTSTSTSNGKEINQIRKKRNGNSLKQGTTKPRKLVSHTVDLTEVTMDTLRRWSPDDDIALIAAITHVTDLRIVHGQMKFSKRYTLQEIEERWYELMYDEEASRSAKIRMEQLDKEKIRAIQSKIPFNAEEAELIRQIPSTILQPTISHFGKLLEKNWEIFHHSRTPKVLEEYWRELKFSGLLMDQKPYITTIEENIEDVAIHPFIETDSDQLPLDVEERQFTRSAVINEREVEEWEGVFTRAITGIPPSSHLASMTPRSIGLLVGRCTTFDIQQERALIGRSTKRHTVDINLTVEGPTARISRKQAIFKLAENGDCLLRNIGKQHIIVDGRVIQPGEGAKLAQNSQIQIAMIKLAFFKNEAYKKTVQQ